MWLRGRTHAVCGWLLVLLLSHAPPHHDHHSCVFFLPLRFVSTCPLATPSHRFGLGTLVINDIILGRFWIDLSVDVVIKNAKTGEGQQQ